MKAVLSVAVAASVVAGVAAQQHHEHRHLHKKHASPVQARDAAYTEVVQGPTMTIYEMNNQVLNPTEAAKGIADGLYVIVGESTPTFSAPPPPPSTTSTSSSAPPTEAAVFKQIETPSEAAPAAPSAAPAAGANVPFPNNQLACSMANLEAYGARPLSQLPLGGFASIQTPMTPWVSTELIETVVEQVTGDVLISSFVSYACDAGFQKAQWPVNSQPANGVSIGGVYCNAENMWQLTNPAQTTLCMPGAGGVYLENQLPQIACVCQTNYPGDEKMSIDNCPAPGATMPLMNPMASDSYQWEGKPTSAQYYINPEGLTAANACVWTSPSNPSNAGNWAPLVLGVGMDTTGTTYLSLFLNTPTTTATLAYPVSITGDISAPCAWADGAFNGDSGSHGCTVSPHRSSCLRSLDRDADRHFASPDCHHAGRHRHYRPRGVKTGLWVLGLTTLCCICVLLSGVSTPTSAAQTGNHNVAPGSHPTLVCAARFRSDGRVPANAFFPTVAFVTSYLYVQDFAVFLVT